MKWIILLLACASVSFSPDTSFAISLSDSTALTPVQISNLQALQAPGQIPVGTVIPWPSDKRIPEPMWLPCNGQYIASGSPLSKAIGGNVIPDLNGVTDTMNSNGKGFFARGGTTAQIVSTDSIRYQYHGQKEHAHQIKMEIKNPNVSGVAAGQTYYDWITGVASGTSTSGEERSNFKSIGGNTQDFRKFQYNINMGFQESMKDGHDPDFADPEKTTVAINKARAAGFYSKEGDPYFFASDNVFGGFAFTVPEGEAVRTNVNDDHARGTVYFMLGHEGVGTDKPRWTTSTLGFTRFLGTIRNKTDGGKIQDNSGGLVDTTVEGTPSKLPIEYDGDNDYEYTGKAETAPQYKNVVYIIKALP